LSAIKHEEHYNKIKLLVQAHLKINRTKVILTKTKTEEIFRKIDQDIPVPLVSIYEASHEEKS